MNKRPLTVVCKLAIFWAKMRFGAKFTVRAPKCRFNDQQQIKIIPENDDSAAFDSILQIGHRFVGNGIQQVF